jgi:hypothetical protein
VSTDLNTTIADDVKVVKPRTNVYTMMLILALIAICISCLLLYFELESYKGEGSDKWPWEVDIPTSMKVVEPESPVLAATPFGMPVPPNCQQPYVVHRC